MLIKQIVLILITFLGNILAEKLQRQFLETWFQLKKDVLSHSKMPKYKMVKIYKTNLRGVVQDIPGYWKLQGKE